MNPFAYLDAWLEARRFASGRRFHDFLISRSDMYRKVRW